jgi:hypothetical protein
MYKTGEIRNALSPLGDVVETVTVTSVAYVEDGKLPPPGSELYEIVLNTDDPDSYQDQIGSLLGAAGLVGITFEIKRNPNANQR